MSADPLARALRGEEDPNLGGVPAARESAPEGEIRLRVDAGALAVAARALARDGARPVTLYVSERPERALAVVFALRGRLVVLRVPLGAQAPASLSSWCPAFRWPELVLAERDELTLRRPGRLTYPDANAIDARVVGRDVFALPYGPVRSGVFEAIQFLIETGGEDVPRVQTRPFFKHRGLEHCLCGFDVDRGTYVAERIAGIASVAYATAYAQAVERALGIEPPVRAQRWRAVYAELERIANHLDVIAKAADTAALSVGAARFALHKENVLRLQAAFTGSRFARGAIVPGGVREDGRVDLDALLRVLDVFDTDLRRDRRLFLSTGSETDRLIGTGHLPRALVEAYGGVGPLARGSGISADARHERPYGDYRRLGLEVVTADAGDAMARVEVRFGELAESVRILRQAIDQLRRRDGELRVALPTASGAAHGWAEAPQGEVVVWVEVEDSRVANAHFASPDLRNWALFDHAFPNDVLTDFAFIEHSFGLTPGRSGSLMLAWITRGLRRGRVTTRYPSSDEEPFLGFRGRVDVFAPEGAGADLEALWACPTGAIAVDERGRVALDRGRCILCGACVETDPERFAFRSTYETAARRRAGLVVGAVDGDDPEEVRRALGDQCAALRRSVHVRHIDAGSDGAEEWEIQALTNPYYDVQRLGIYFTAAPRHADILLVTGGVTEPMREPLLRTWEVMPHPKALVAVGTDACSGGVAADGGLVAGGADRLLPVDVYVPGSPPSPIAILHGLLLAMGVLREDGPR